MAENSPILSAIRKKSLTDLKRALRAEKKPPAPRALGAAAAAFWTEGLSALVAAGGDINGLYRNYRPLHCLIQREAHAAGDPFTPERRACLEWMLAHGADAEALAAWPSARALVVAAFGGEREIVHILKAHGARIDVFTASALGDARTVERLLAKDRGLALARDGGLLTALQCCGGSRMGASDAKVSAGLAACARALVAAGADVNARTKSWSHEVTVSYFVIRSGQVEMLRLLLDHGLDATEAVAAAAWDNREDILDILLRHGARLDEAFDHTRPVLNELVRWGQFKPARMLLGKGANPNVPDRERGWTAVHQAVSRGNVAMLKDLLDAGGNPAARDSDGVQPRDLARGKNRRQLLALL